MNDIIDVCSIHKYMALSSKEASEPSGTRVLCVTLLRGCIKELPTLNIYWIPIYVTTATSRSKQPKYFAASEPEPAEAALSAKIHIGLKELKLLQRLNRFLSYGIFFFLQH